MRATYVPQVAAWSYAGQQRAITRPAPGRPTDLSPSELNAAIDLLAPAEAARMFNHPNLLAWRKISADWQRDPLAQAFVVFVADFSDDVTSP